MTSVKTDFQRLKNGFKRCIGAIGQALKDYRHWICITFTLGFLALAVFYFKNADLRIIEAGRDVGYSAVFYVKELFELSDGAKVTVNEYSAAPFKLPFHLPDTWEEFQVSWSAYWNIWASSETLNGYMTFLGDMLFYVSKILCILVPIISLVLLILVGKERPINNDYNKDSKWLKKWRKFEKKVYVQVKHCLRNFLRFIKESGYLKLWAWIWAYNFNVIAIALEFFAFYLYFITAFDFVSIYVQVVKLLRDLSVALYFIPIVIWVIIGLWLMDRFRRKIGYERLEHMEMKNRGFINERPIVFMLCGTMGKRKTTLITDMAISQEIMFRDKAFELILECDLKFPYFPWINLEMDVRKAMQNHSVYNLATCRRFAKSKARKFYKRPQRRRIFMYDYERYGMEYDDKLSLVNIWKVIEDYVQLYFIYVMESTLLISNYSIRVDNVLDDLGNFPIWNSELFKKDSRLLEAYSRHAKILDFDWLRPGKRILDENKNCFEFGVVVITEIGKERGNNLELQQVKKNDETANQKNDLFNSWLKMIRHTATVMNFPFVRVIVDEQRPESWGADARDLCEIVHIDESSEKRLSMPLFALGDLFLDWIQGRFEKRYVRHRFERGDNTLPIYLFHGAAAKMKQYHTGIFNTFGYYKMRLQVENGTQDGELTERGYYLMFGKIYRLRFSTDCFSGVFEEQALRALFGIIDMREFKTEKASFEEMSVQNSYFFNDLIKLKNRQ